MQTTFTEAYTHATLMVSLLSVWVLVGLFYYLNRYTKREYFTIWTAAWLFYALWLTLSLTLPQTDPNTLPAMLKQSCVAISAAFLLWGTLRFLDIPVRQTLFGLFILFLVAWTFFIPRVALSVLQIQLPVFILLGSGSIFAGVCFYRARRNMPYVGAGLLALGFFLWGVYLGSYPLSRQYASLHSIGYLVAAVLQLFIAVSMIVLVLEEVRYKTEKILAEISEVKSQKQELEAKILTTEERYREMYDQVRLTEGSQRAYDELRRTQQIVVQQERLRALGQMASGVAHDINNALSPITAYAELLEKTVADLPEAPARYLRNIQSAAEDVAHIVGRMREFYRQRTNEEELDEVDVNGLCQEVIELTRPRWRDVSQRQGISISVAAQFEAELPLLIGDVSELREALINLVFNSVDAMPQGGIINLVTRSAEGAATASHPAEPLVLIEVRDNGMGMDDKTRQRCLEPFFTTKAQRGTGLGLAMVYGMVQRHEGSVEIESTVGQGTLVRLSLPVRAAARRRKPRKYSAAVPGRSLRVLCIDDEPRIRELLNDCLSVCGHTVSLAPGGREGLDLFLGAMQKRQPFDVVITDLGMPDVDGQQVARSIKSISPKTPIVMMTGWGSMMNDAGEKAVEVAAVVGKPPRVEELHALLLRLCA
jgi:signal transduction histidine kinase/ActR/RegA family two-component response regulator